MTFRFAAIAGACALGVVGIFALWWSPFWVEEPASGPEPSQLSLAREFNTHRTAFANLLALCAKQPRIIKSKHPLSAKGARTPTKDKLMSDLHVLSCWETDDRAEFTMWIAAHGLRGAANKGLIYSPKLVRPIFPNVDSPSHDSATVSPYHDSIYSRIDRNWYVIFDWDA